MGPDAENWIVRYHEGVWKVHGWVEGDRVRVQCTPIRRDSPPLYASVNIWPPGHGEQDSYLGLSLKDEGPLQWQGSASFGRGTSHLQLTIGFAEPRPWRAQPEQTSFLLKGWTVTR